MGRVGASRLVTHLVSWLCWTSWVKETPAPRSPRPAGMRLRGLEPSVWGQLHGPNQPEFEALTRDGGQPLGRHTGVSGGFSCSGEEGSSLHLEVGWWGSLAPNMGLMFCGRQRTGAQAAPRAAARQASPRCSLGGFLSLVEGRMGVVRVPQEPGQARRSASRWRRPRRTELWQRAENLHAGVGGTGPQWGAPPAGEGGLRDSGGGGGGGCQAARTPGVSSHLESEVFAARVSCGPAGAAPAAVTTHRRRRAPNPSLFPRVSGRPTSPPRCLCEPVRGLQTAIFCRCPHIFPLRVCLCRPPLFVRTQSCS